MKTVLPHGAREKGNYARGGAPSPGERMAKGEPESGSGDSVTIVRPSPSKGVGENCSASGCKKKSSITALLGGLSCKTGDSRRRGKRMVEQPSRQRLVGEASRGKRAGCIGGVKNLGKNGCPRRALLILQGGKKEAVVGNITVAVVKLNRKTRRGLS